MSPSSTGPGTPVGISPRVDCVFRALFADPAHTDRLLDFLNAVLTDRPPIVSVTITNPVKILEFLGDKDMVVDLLARDAEGTLFQVEMQSWGHTGLKERMLYAWSALYQRQSGAGKTFGALRPVISIWLVDKNCFRAAREFHHRFQVMSREEGIVLSDDLDIHVLELDRWREGSEWKVAPAIGRWMSFFSGAEGWADVPPSLQSPVLEDAMTVLQTFRDNNEWNHAYRARLEFQMIQASMAEDLEKKQRETEAALQAKERAEARAEAAGAEADRERAEKERERAEKEREHGEKMKERAEKERFRALLLQAGLLPDES